jgi:hypothetical protein
MKNYLIRRLKDGTLHLLAQAQTKKGLVDTEIVGQFDIGDATVGAHALALEIMVHYFGSDVAGAAEAARKADAFMWAFLAHHRMDEPGATYEVSSDVIDSFLARS